MKECCDDVFFTEAKFCPHCGKELRPASALPSGVAATQLVFEETDDYANHEYAAETPLGKFELKLWEGSWQVRYLFWRTGYDFSTQEEAEKEAQREWEKRLAQSIIGPAPAPSKPTHPASPWLSAPSEGIIPIPPMSLLKP